VIKIPPGKNPYVFVEFKNEQGAAKARTAVFLEDRSGLKRKELGDSTLEITYSKQKDNSFIDSTGLLGQDP